MHATISKFLALIFAFIILVINANGSIKDSIPVSLANPYFSGNVGGVWLNNKVRTSIMGMPSKTSFFIGLSPLYKICPSRLPRYLVCFTAPSLLRR